MFEALKVCSQGNLATVTLYPTTVLRHPNIACFLCIYYPPGARVPSLVMERIHFSRARLQSNLFTREHSGDVALGLHTRDLPFIHRVIMFCFQ